MEMRDAFAAEMNAKQRQFAQWKEDHVRIIQNAQVKNYLVLPKVIISFIRNCT